MYEKLLFSNILSMTNTALDKVHPTPEEKKKFRYLFLTCSRLQFLMSWYMWSWILKFDDQVYEQETSGVRQSGQFIDYIFSKDLCGALGILVFAIFFCNSRMKNRLISWTWREKVQLVIIDSNFLSESQLKTIQQQIQQ